MQKPSARVHGSFNMKPRVLRALYYYLPRSLTPSAEEAAAGGDLNGFVHIPPAFSICMYGNTLHMLVSAIARD